MKKTNDEIEVQEFLKSTPVIPCFLISKDEGRIELSLDGFEKKDIPIQKIKENYFIVTYQEDIEDFRLIVDSKISSDISLYGNGLNFERKKDKNSERNKEKKVFVGEYKLYSFNIKEEDLSFSKYYIDQFKQIANSNASNEKKAEELENIFTNIGYYIPKKIYIGGMLINHTDKVKRAKTVNTINSLDFSFNKNIKLDSGFSSSNKNKLNEIYNSEKTEIIGGNYTSKNFEEWIKSIKLSNSSVIECSNIITAKNILQYDLRKKLEIPLKMIEDKYSRKKKYLEYFDQIRDKKVFEKKGDNNFSVGICKEMKESSEPHIYKKKFTIDTKVSIIPAKYKEKFYESFNDIIVGFEIHEDRGDGHNGEWKIKNEPLGTKELAIRFESGRHRGQDFTINVYLLENPK